MKVYFYVNDKPVTECDIEFNTALTSYLNKRFKEGKEPTERIKCDEFFLYSFLECAFDRNDTHCYTNVPGKMYSVWQYIVDTDAQKVTVEILGGNTMKETFVLNTKFLTFSIDAEDFIKRCKGEIDWKTPTKRMTYTIDANATITVFSPNKDCAADAFNTLWEEFITKCTNLSCGVVTTADVKSNCRLVDNENE